MKGEWQGTCSIDDQKDWHITFARTREYLKKLNGTDLHIGVFVPKNIDSSGLDLSNVILWSSDFFEYEFVKLHNSIYRHDDPDEDVFGRNSEVDASVRIAEGIHISIGPNNARVQLKHMGNVVVESGARVGPLTFIQRGSLKGCSTIIKEEALIDGYCVVAHNVVFGEKSLAAAGTIVGAGSIIGKNCLIGIQTAIKPHTTIVDHVVTGIGSVVTRDLLKPGIYFGNPATFKREHDPNWMW
jgi:acetyltransferase-like isoleucine patch superfamily enzyme